MKEGDEAEGTVRLTHQGPDCLCREFRFDFSCSGDLVKVSSRMVVCVCVAGEGSTERDGAMEQGSFLGCSWAPAPACLPIFPLRQDNHSRLSKAESEASWRPRS